MKNLLIAYAENNSIDLFWEIYESRKETLKLTAPQERVLRELKSGSVIVIINEHHRSGGDWTWNGESGGAIYKSYWNAIDKVLQGCPRIRTPKGFVLSENEFNNL